MALNKDYLMVAGLVAAAAVAVATSPFRSPVAEPVAETLLAGDDEVLAEVGGSLVTRYDVERTIAETLNEAAIRQLDEDGRRRALESIVATRAIARVREAELDGAAREAFERKISRYRDQLLVRDYLDVHAPPAPVTQEMIREYYEDHPDRFVGGTERSYEMVFSTRSLTAPERERLVRGLRSPDQHPDWRAWAATLGAQELPVSHRRGDASSSALHARVRQALEPLRVGQVSPVVFVEGRAFLLRITGEEQRPRRPLAEVREQIRRRLGPGQLRESVREVRTTVLRDAEVVYR